MCFVSGESCVIHSAHLVIPAQETKKKVWQSLSLYINVHTRRRGEVPPYIHLCQHVPELTLHCDVKGQMFGKGQRRRKDTFTKLL